MLSFMNWLFIDNEIKPLVLDDYSPRLSDVSHRFIISKPPKPKKRKPKPKKPKAKRKSRAKPKKVEINV